LFASFFLSFWFSFLSVSVYLSLMFSVSLLLFSLDFTLWFLFSLFLSSFVSFFVSFFHSLFVSFFLCFSSLFLFVNCLRSFSLSFFLSTGESWQWRSFREKASEREPAGSVEEAPENFVTDKFLPVIRPFEKLRYLIGQIQNHRFSKTWRWFSENLGIRPLALLREWSKPKYQVLTQFSVSFQLQFSIAG
jgi:hypothetical protein